MRSLGIVLISLGLAACNPTGAYPTTVTAKPVVLDIGDSVSLQYTRHARNDLCTTVILQHEGGTLQDDQPENNQDCVEHPIQQGTSNDGCSSAELAQIPARLAPWHYTVIAFNAGLHDMQDIPVLWKQPGGIMYRCGGPLPLDEYKQNIEALAGVMKEHADVVIWVDTTPVYYSNRENVPPGSQDAYNAAAEAVAREHGFYVLRFTDVLENPDDIHLSPEGTLRAGQQLADCITTALNQSETANCHK